MTWLNGFKETNLMIGGNVTNDFLDNLGAEQYEKMYNRGNVKRPGNPEEKERREKYLKELLKDD